MTCTWRESRRTREFSLAFWGEGRWIADARGSAMITLHNNFIDFSNDQSISTMRCIQATRAILDALHRLSETSLDTTRLHPFIVVRPFPALMSRSC